MIRYLAKLGSYVPRTRGERFKWFPLNRRGFCCANGLYADMHGRDLEEKFHRSFPKPLHGYSNPNPVKVITIC